MEHYFKHSIWHNTKLLIRVNNSSRYRIIKLNDKNIKFLSQLVNVGPLGKLPISKDSSMNKYKKSKLKPLTTTLSIADLFNDSKDFKFVKEYMLLLSKSKNKTNYYTVLVKLSVEGGSYLMAGNQIPYIHNNKENLIELRGIIQSRIIEISQKYKVYAKNINYINIIFRGVDKVLYNKLKLNITHDNEVENSVLRKVKNIVSIISDFSEDNIGKPLSVISNDKGHVISVDIIIDGVKVNIIDLIMDKNKLLNHKHKDYIEFFDISCKFYHIKSGVEHVLIVRNITEANSEYDTTQILKYSLSGSLLHNVLDKKHNDVLLSRTIGSDTHEFKDNEVILSRQNIKLNPLTVVKKQYTNFLNKNIGVIDIETYLDTTDNIYKVCAIGYKTRTDFKTTYIDRDNYDSNKLVIDVIVELLKPKYDNIKFYCHNLAGFDIVYILKALYLYNDRVQDDKLKFVITPIFRDDKFIKVTITQLCDNKKRTLVLLDSYCILTSSLAKLCIDYETAYKKTYFPYEFAKKENLFYEGVTPSIDFYTKISPKDYNELYKEHWSFEATIMEYLENDLNALFNVLNNANQELWEEFNISILEAPTISGLAMKIYLNDYYDNNIPRINKISMYKDLSQALYGGITEVYKPYGENLYYYDVNSLYPFASLNDMPGLECDKITFINLDVDAIDNLFGFFYCKIKAPIFDYLGLLPKREATGIISPLGEWEGWYFSEELKYAKSQKYTVTVLKGYNFNRVENVFNKYVNQIYKTKSNPKSKSQKALAKSILNNLILNNHPIEPKPNVFFLHYWSIDIIVSLTLLIDQYIYIYIYFLFIFRLKVIYWFIQCYNCRHENKANEYNILHVYNDPPWYLSQKL